MKYLNKCDLEKALETHFDLPITLTPFVATNTNDFIVNDNTAYIGTVTMANNEEIDIISYLVGKDWTNYLGEVCLFTETTPDQTIFFQGFQISCKEKLYRKQIFNLKISTTLHAWNVAYGGDPTALIYNFNVWSSEPLEPNGLPKLNSYLFTDSYGTTPLTYTGTTVRLYYDGTDVFPIVTDGNGKVIAIEFPK